MARAVHGRGRSVAYDWWRPRQSSQTEERRGINRAGTHALREREREREEGREQVQEQVQVRARTCEQEKAVMGTNGQTGTEKATRERTTRVALAVMLALLPGAGRARQR